MSVDTGSRLTGAFADPATGSARAFRAILDAMARPGAIRRIDEARPPEPLGPAAGAVALTLCDPDTPIWLAPPLATAPLRRWLAFHTGAPVTDNRRDAIFAFGSWAQLSPADAFAIGSPEYPDRSATLVVEVGCLEGDTRLTGPGVESEARLAVPDIAFFQRNAALYPLGLDFILTCGAELAAVPRSSRIEA